MAKSATTGSCHSSASLATDAPSRAEYLSEARERPVGFLGISEYSASCRIEAGRGPLPDDARMVERVFSVPGNQNTNGGLALGSSASTSLVSSHSQVGIRHISGSGGGAKPITSWAIEFEWDAELGATW